MNEVVSKHQFKITIATAVIVVLFIIGMSMQYASWSTEIEHQVKDNTAQLEKNKEHIIDLENDRNDIQVELATIKTKLAAIEGLLVEIKMDLRDYTE